MNKDKTHLVIAIDFDGTIVDLAFPKVGAIKQDAAKYINMLYDEGHEIVINTCRAGKYEGDAEAMLKEHGIQYHYINCNMPWMIEFYSQDCRKISADLYIDDKCLMGLPDTWEEIYNKVQEQFPIIFKSYNKDESS